MKRFWSLAAILVLLAALLAACGGSPRATTTESKSMEQSVSAPMAPGSAYSRDSAPAPNAAAKPAGPQAAPGQPASAPIPQASDRKIILNAQFDLKVKDADEMVQKVSITVRGAGGYVQETKQSGTKQQGRTVTMSLRVPAGQYGPITDLIRSAGEVVGQREWTQDVTAEFVDLDARKKSQEIHLAQLEKLMTQGGSIKELMEVEAEVARVNTDLESIKGRLRLLDNLVSYSTIIVTLYEPGAPAPIEPPKTLAERITRGFTGSWHGVVNFAGDLLVFVISALPVLVFMGILLGIPTFFAVRSSRRRRKQPPTPPDQQQSPFPR
ncbi:MAG TPA: DUF4349 domain-containing protein [Symbiobacteriaceae bacterium]|jgi:hypothetical protein